MTIRKKLWISNILMVVVPIFFTVVCVAVCIQTSLGNYWYALEHMYQDENGIQSAQSLIYTYQEELWEMNWSELCDPVTGEMVSQSENMNHLEGQLSDMGYHILVEKNGNVLYSSVTEDETAAARKAAGDAIYKAKTLTLSEPKISIVKNTFLHEGKVLSILAINSREKGGQVKSYLQNYIFRYIVIFLSVFFLVTIAANLVLSWWISRSILIPLSILGDGTRRIRDGELDTKLAYEKKDEFGAACRDFEEMGSYLKESVEQRQEDDRRRREMISGISHDLRTPLTSIGGYLDGLMEGIADTPEKQSRYLNAIKIRTKDLERLVESLSQYNRLERKSMKYQFAKADFRCFLEQYLADCAEEARQNQVVIRWEAKDPPYYLALDEAEMKRVFDNFFTNTVRYREKECSLVIIRLFHSEDRRWIQLMFQDDGPGVPEESLSRIFETFYRADSARSHAGDGSGIGLAVVKEIISGHGGDVWAENRGGLAIWVRLPAWEERLD